MEIKKIDRNQRDTAIQLVSAVFMQFEAPDYSVEGVETFKRTTIYNNDFLDSLNMYGAYESETLLGVIATRNKGNHIALFFVDGKHHRQGIGKKLFQIVLENSTAKEITVNSSPYAVEVYHRLGFVDIAPEEKTNEIRYIPMVYSKVQ
ncbi:Acetyltransferase (GNAT) domain-containing protein [Clostridium amylolyticum]|uniref:Acetyltransferase (GNAT) domain-containing protein n=1 Tax=Clostridium amylolyticum TaxID=1121298 RepID=A0A1M6ID38_9CLOT|nr:GNAT family N-acetyltransferase [Clostridium amylolyticum]SHJ32340.1 Acetyltransferase (GNAT) domain-containing protein [Clostridium amylolyticum]